MWSEDVNWLHLVKSLPSHWILLKYYNLFIINHVIITLYLINLIYLITESQIQIIIDQEPQKQIKQAIIITSMMISAFYMLNTTLIPINYKLSFVSVVLSVFMLSPCELFKTSFQKFKLSRQSPQLFGPSWLFLHIINL